MTSYAKEWFSLFELARTLHERGKIHISSTEFAKSLRVSQQTASRRLRALEQEGWIERKVEKFHQIVVITEEGWAELQSIYAGLTRIFKKPGEPILVRGKLASGWGDGKNYIQVSGYMEQFVESLGYEPYPGTLNVEISDHEDLVARKMIEEHPGVRIAGFQNGDRSYGDVTCYPVKINGEIGALLSIDRTHHEKKTIELISPHYLRDKLNLEDGDWVEVQFQQASALSED